jgi:hypothetical protein
MFSTNRTASANAGQAITDELLDGLSVSYNMEFSMPTTDDDESHGLLIKGASCRPATWFRMLVLVRRNHSSLGLKQGTCRTTLLHSST